MAPSRASQRPPPDSGLRRSRLPMPAACGVSGQPSAWGHPTARAGESEERGLRCPDRPAQGTSSTRGDEEAAGTLRPQSVPTDPSFPRWVPFSHGLGLAPAAARPGEDAGLAFGPLGYPPGRAEAEQVGDAGRPRNAPGEQPTRGAPFPRCPSWLRHARLPRGAGPPPGTHPAPQRPHPRVVAAAPSQAVLPIWRGRGTNQPPGVVRPSGWGLIDTRWPLPRGRLGGGSARQGGQAPGRGARHPGLAGSGLPWGEQGSQAAAGHPSPPLPPAASVAHSSPAFLGSDLSFISEAAGTVTASAQEEGGSGFPPDWLGAARSDALGPQRPGPVGWLLRRDTRGRRRPSPRPSFIEHLLHARP